MCGLSLGLGLGLDMYWVGVGFSVRIQGWAIQMVGNE